MVTPGKMIESVTWASWSMNALGPMIDRSTCEPDTIDPWHSRLSSTNAGSPPRPRDTFAGGSALSDVYIGHLSL